MRPIGVIAFAVSALVFLLLLNAPAMLHSADLLRSSTKALEQRCLEPPPPTIPNRDAPALSEDDDDDDLDQFLDF